MRVADPTAGLWFSFHVEDEEFIAFISDACLRTCFSAANASDRALLRAYTANQPLIDSIARRKFLNGTARPIRLAVADFADAVPAAEKATAPASSYK